MLTRMTKMVLGLVAAVLLASSPGYAQEPAPSRWQHLLDSIKHVESGGNPYARSKAGARGAYQFMPDTARRLHINPWNPKSARKGAHRYMQYLLNEFGSLDAALAAWNWGEGNVQRSIRRHGYFSVQHAPRETQHFVANVLHGYRVRNHAPLVEPAPTVLPLRPAPHLPPPVATSGHLIPPVSATRGLIPPVAATVAPPVVSLSPPRVHRTRDERVPAYIRRLPTGKRIFQHGHWEVAVWYQHHGRWHWHYVPETSVH